MANTTAVVNGSARCKPHAHRGRRRAVTGPAGAQAAVRHELLENAAAAGRAGRIAQALADFGAPPDPVGAALGWASGLLRATVEQAQPLDQALPGDLALQHQLAESARYLLTGEVPVAVRELAEQLVHDHEATIERLRVVLTEPAAELQPTPLQTLTVGVARVAVLPARLTLAGLQRCREAPDADAPAARAPGPRLARPPRPPPPCPRPPRPASRGWPTWCRSSRPDFPDTELPDTDLADLGLLDVDAAFDAEADADLADVVAIDPEAGDIKTTVSDPDTEVDTAADAELTVVDPDVDILAVVEDTADEPTVEEVPVDEIATEAARWDDTCQNSARSVRSPRASRRAPWRPARTGGGARPGRHPARTGAALPRTGGSWGR